jgi:predicted ester cyclase
MAADLGAHYRRYIALLNSHALSAAALAPFVHDAVTFNGAPLSREAYCELCRRALADPAAHIDIDRLIVQDAGLAARIAFARKTSQGESTPGLMIRGRLVTAEHAIYHFEEGRIRTVWTIVEAKQVDPAKRYVPCDVSASCSQSAHVQVSCG